jgi:hypothetical protein
MTGSVEGPRSRAIKLAASLIYRQVDRMSHPPLPGWGKPRRLGAERKDPMTGRDAVIGEDDIAQADRAREHTLGAPRECHPWTSRTPMAPAAGTDRERRPAARQAPRRTPSALIRAEQWRTCGIWAVELDARGLVARVLRNRSGVAFVRVVNPLAVTLRESVTCAPSPAGLHDWYYWWSWGACTHRVDDPAGAASKVAHVLDTAGAPAG